LLPSLLVAYPSSLPFSAPPLFSCPRSWTAYDEFPLPPVTVNVAQTLFLLSPFLPLFFVLSTDSPPPPFPFLPMRLNDFWRLFLRYTPPSWGPLSLLSMKMGTRTIALFSGALISASFRIGPWRGKFSTRSSFFSLLYLLSMRRPFQ